MSRQAIILINNGYIYCMTRLCNAGPQRINNTIVYLMTWSFLLMSRVTANHSDYGLIHLKRTAHGNPDSKVHGANMGPTRVLSDPDGPHVGPMNLAIREGMSNQWPGFLIAPFPFVTLELTFQMSFPGQMRMDKKGRVSNMLWPSKGKWYELITGTGILYTSFRCFRDIRRIVEFQLKLLSITPIPIPKKFDAGFGPFYNECGKAGEGFSGIMNDSVTHTAAHGRLSGRTVLYNDGRQSHHRTRGFPTKIIVILQKPTVLIIKTLWRMTKRWWIWWWWWCWWC